MGLYFGVDYYPEHWPCSRWEQDAVLMRDMGVDVVRMGEFAWAALQPQADRFDFRWLDDAIALMGRHGIQAVLGTPTAAPPAWLVEQDPSILPMDCNGQRLHFGGRHHTCHSSPTYHRHAAAIAQAMGQHFGENPYVVGWQIDNELGNSHDDLCCCDSCSAAFREWLAKKYGTIHALNDAWGNVFWSQTLTSFEQAGAPLRTVAGRNPSALLDWKRFCSELICGFADMQAEILRQSSPGRFITHNGMGFANKVDYYALARSLDFISHDQYPAAFYGRQPQETPEASAAPLDFMRGVKNRSFWVMEQQAGITGWEVMGRCPKPGQLALWAMQSVAHGADCVVFFRWRSSAVGTEQYWHGVLPHHGMPGARYRELSTMISAFRPVVRAVQRALPHADAAIVFSYDQYRALQLQPHHPDLDYMEQLMAYYGGLHRRNVPMDIIPVSVDFSCYRLLIAPLQYLLDDALAQKYADFVQAGGHLVLTMRCGVKDEHNRCHTGTPPPGPVATLAGVEVEGYDCLREAEATLCWEGKKYTARRWCDLVCPVDAEAVAHYTTGWYAGTPAVTVRRPATGGSVWYVGCDVDAAMADALAEALLRESGVVPLLDAPRGVEVCRRRAGDTDYFFLLNHTEMWQRVAVPKGWELCAGQQPLPPYGVSVFRA